jgi:putative toxin-antitoxin system antitoxin component (TIGR02293 family)
METLNDADRRLAEVTVVAERVWQDPDAARSFLERPHPMLGGARPLDVVRLSAAGADQVIAILGRLQHGSAG